MTILVRDEELLLEANLQYHLSRGVDFIIATDNRSVDRTPAILRKYERRGLLEYIYEPTDDYSQDRWVTRMAQLAADYGADWVFHVDADEFWWPETGTDLKEPLSTVPESVEGLVVQRSNFVYLGDDKDAAFYCCQIFRERRPLNPLGDPLPAKICHRGVNDVQVAQGNHSFSINGREPHTQNGDSFLIFHYPIHSSIQFKHKIRVGGAAYDRNDRLRGRAGQTWTSLYYEFQKDPSTLDRYLEQKTYCQTDIQQGCGSGELIKDVRLRDYLMDLARK